MTLNTFITQKDGRARLCMGVGDTKPEAKESGEWISMDSRHVVEIEQPPEAGPEQ